MGLDPAVNGDSSSALEALLDDVAAGEADTGQACSQLGRWTVMFKEEANKEMTSESQALRQRVQLERAKDLYVRSPLGPAPPARGSHRPTWSHADFFAMSEADKRVEAMRRAIAAAEQRVEEDRKAALRQKERRSSFSLANSVKRRASFGLSPEAERERRASIGFVDHMVATAPVLPNRRPFRPKIDRISKIPMSIP